MRRAALLLLLLTACDWEHFGLVNSVPLPPPRNAGRPVHVFLGLDGVSRAAFDEARRQGAFADFSASTLISMYPATSDASWSRILRTRRFPGYEYTHFDEAQDTVVDPGLEGLLQHVLPPFEGFPGSQAPAYYRAFDVHAGDYLDAVGSYTTTTLSFERALDQIFFTLGGRLDTQDVFFAYVLETDVLGHDESMGSTVAALKALSDRLQDFRANHPEYPLSFTLFTDHGLDHVQKASDDVLHTAAEIASTGVRLVSSFSEGRRQEQPWAVVIEHNRTTYVAVHTDAALADEVARRISTNPKFDLVVARSVPVGDGLPVGWPRVSLWNGGARAAFFAFDAETDTYWLARGLSEGFGVTLPDGSEPFVPFSDQALFDATMGKAYPDVFFRARTALLPLSVENPAQVVVSMPPRYVALGFAAPGFGSAGTAGSHGSLARASSEGVLATQERELPPYTRSDNVLDLFPALRAHIEARHGPLEPGDRNRGLAGQAAP